MKKLSLILFCVSSVVCSYAQVKNQMYAEKKPMDLMFGIGIGMAYSEFLYINCPLYQLEVSKKINSRIAASANIGFISGKNFKRNYINEMEGKLSRQQFELNFLYSPWRNNRRNDFKMGFGISTMHTKLTYVAYTKFIDNQIVEQKSETVRFWNLLGNLIVENDFKIVGHWIVGIKGILQLKQRDDLIIQKVEEYKPFFHGSYESYHGDRAIPAIIFSIGYIF